MLDFSDPNSSNMIFTEDLKNMIHLAESTSDDLDLVHKMMKRYIKIRKTQVHTRVITASACLFLNREPITYNCPSKHLLNSWVLLEE